MSNKMSNINRYLLITAGLLSLSTGIVGIFVPVLPTTPFLLLSSACFLKSSTSLYRWLIRHKFFGKFIENYMKYRAVSRKSKIASILILWCVLISSIFFVEHFFVKILLGTIGIGVTIHLLLLRSLENIKKVEGSQDSKKNLE